MFSPPWKRICYPSRCESRERRDCDPLRRGPARLCPTGSAAYCGVERRGRHRNRIAVACPPDSHLGQPLHRRIASRIFNFVASHILKLPFRDTQCGLKTLTLDAANRVFPLLSLNGWGYDSELIHVALTRCLQVAEVDLRFVHDYRNSHFRPLTDGCATLSELFEIRWNDFRGAYGHSVPGSMSFRESAKPGMNFLQESPAAKPLEVPANSPSDDLAA